MTSTARQLELTINALCRATRRTLRIAEQQDPTGTQGIWAAVEHRCKLLKEMMAAAAEFTKATHREVAPAEEKPQPKPHPTPALEAATKPATSTPPAKLPTAALMEAYGNTRLADLPPVGAPDAPAPELDPRFRLAQLLSARAIAHEPVGV